MSVELRVPTYDNPTPIDGRTLADGFGSIVASELPEGAPNPIDLGESTTDTTPVVLVPSDQIVDESGLSETGADVILAGTIGTIVLGAVYAVRRMRNAFQSMRAQ